MSHTPSSSYPLQSELSDALLNLPESAVLLTQQLEQTTTSEDLDALLKATLGAALLQPLDVDTLLPAVDTMLEQLNLPSLEASRKLS